MNDRVVVIEFANEEATHLEGLITQFAELVEQTTDAAPRDPAVLRLVPDAYTDDPEAAGNFRSLTQSELLERRAAEAARVLAMLHEVPRGTSSILLALDDEDAQVWLRTLAAIRLVLASRLGVVSEDDHDQDDPRFGIYEWLGYRLDGIVRAIDDLE